MMEKPTRFTLVELLVVIAIISILAAILLPGIRKAIALTDLTQCQSNMRQIGIAMHLRANDHKGRFYISRGDPSDTHDRYNLNGGILHPESNLPTHQIVKEFMYNGWNKYNLDTYNPPQGKLNYITDIRVFACPTVLSESFWDEEKNYDYGHIVPLREYYFKVYGAGFYLYTLFDSHKGGDRTNQNGCHKYAPSPEHPPHTWTYVCMGHNVVSGYSPRKLEYKRDNTSKKKIIARTIRWEPAFKYTSHPPYETGNALYVDGHVKYHDFIGSYPGHFHENSNEFVNDDCKRLRGDNCKR